MLVYAENHIQSIAGVRSFAEVLLGASQTTLPEELRNVGSVPKILLPDYQRLMSSTTKHRLSNSRVGAQVITTLSEL